MMVLLFVLSILGFVASIGIHVVTFFPTEVSFDQAWLINGVLCAVWSPLLVLGTHKIFDLTTVGHKWTMIPKHSPEWTKKIAVILLTYAMVNFLFTMIVLNQGGFPAIVNGQMVLHTYNFGKVIEQLTPSEYVIHQAYITRVLSGHWIFFFWMGILASHTHLVEGALRRQTERKLLRAVEPALNVDQGK